jgi:hypothetical protein
MPVPFVLFMYWSPVASFRITISASGMTLPEVSTTMPLIVASGDCERVKVVTQRSSNSRRRAHGYFKRNSSSRLE